MSTQSDEIEVKVITNHAWNVVKHKLCCSLSSTLDGYGEIKPSGDDSTSTMSLYTAVLSNSSGAELTVGGMYVLKGIDITPTVDPYVFFVAGIADQSVKLFIIFLSSYAELLKPILSAGSNQTEKSAALSVGVGAAMDVINSPNLYVCPGGFIDNFVPVGISLLGSNKFVTGLDTFEKFGLKLLGECGKLVAQSTSIKFNTASSIDFSGLISSGDSDQIGLEQIDDSQPQSSSPAHYSVAIVEKASMKVAPVASQRNHSAAARQVKAQNGKEAKQMQEKESFERRQKNEESNAAQTREKKQSKKLQSAEVSQSLARIKTLGISRPFDQYSKDDLKRFNDSLGLRVTGEPNQSASYSNLSNLLNLRFLLYRQQR